MSGPALLFADLVDSTLLVERLGDARAAQLFAEHDRRARDLLAAHGGREIDRSDGFFLLFDDVDRAAAFALAYHRALAELELSARVAVHVGPILQRENSAEDVARGAKRIEVEGIAKPVAARVMALARGGQTLLTAAARDALGAQTAAAAALERHGHYRLKGVAAPIELFGIGAREGAASAPPADTEKAYRVIDVDGFWRPVREVRHNLPAERDAFVGRGDELRALAARLDGGARLVTVLGAGGTGKTRFVTRYAWTWLGDWPGGVHLCDLSEARSLDGICSAVAAALDVALGHADPVAQLGHAIAARRRCLVILDNFEQVASHARATVGRWLDQAPDASFVVTSRERLQLPGEEILALEPLDVRVEAIELFALRARAQQGGFELTPANRADVARIVTLLDGLPLAIELAAARVRLLSPARLLARMSDRFGVLAEARGAASRQATLRGAIDWSWQLLAGWEQAALAQCSAFEGGFTLAAAEAVLDLSPWPDAPAAIDAVQSLVDKSLLRTWIAAAQGRHDFEEPYFGMYLSIHDYAAEKLAATGAAARADAEARHGRHFACFGSDEALDLLHGHGSGPRRQALALELDNLVAACRRASASGDAATATLALRAAWEILGRRGPLRLGVELGARVAALADSDQRWRPAALTTWGEALLSTGQSEASQRALEQALGLARETKEERLEARALAALGSAVRLAGRPSEARPHYEAALAIERRRGDRCAEGNVLALLGIVERETGRMDRAEAAHQAALALVREVGDGFAEARIHNHLGIVHAEQSRADAARSHFEASVALGRDLGDRRQEGLALGNLACLEQEQGRTAAARVCFDAALVIHRELGDRREEGIVLFNLGAGAQTEGRLADARALFEAGTAIAREVGNRRGEGFGLGSLGSVALDQGHIDEAKACFEAALAINRAAGDRRSQGMVLGGLADVLGREGRRDEARAALGEGELHLREIGCRLDLAALFCVRGRLECDAGAEDAARAALRAAEAIVEETQAEPASEIHRQIRTLRETLARSFHADTPANAAPPDDAAGRMSP